jgi:hypothetical protein
VNDEITGDLNGDRAADLVFVLARNDENQKWEKYANDETDGKLEKYEEVPRRLVVAFREKGGYRQVLTNDEVISTLGQERTANVFTILRVERGSLVVWQCGGGGNTKWTTLNRSRWSKEGFRQVGYTATGMALSANSGLRGYDEFDVNLLTEMIELSHVRWRVAAERQARGYPKRRRYHLLPVIDSTALPATLATPLSSRVVRLNDRADVVLGGPGWKGIDDLSAMLSAATLGKGAMERLYVRALVRDSGDAALGEVRLMSACGAALRPERTKRSAAPGGYVWQAQYLLSSLKTRDDRLLGGRGDKVETQVEGFPATPPEPFGEFCKASLEVVSRSPSGGERRVLSTARSRKLPSLLWRTNSKLPRLGVASDTLFQYGFEFE